MKTMMGKGWTAMAALLAIIVLIAGCAPATPAAQPTAAAPTEPAPAATEVATQPAATEAPATPVEVSGAGDVSVDGTWEGAIKIAGQEIQIRLEFKDGGGTVDLPQQAAVDLPIKNFKLEGSTVTFEMLPAPQTAAFMGTVEGETMSGAFTQSGLEGEFSVTRAAAATASVEPKSYKEEEVTFKNGVYTLAGTLSLPAAGGPHPAVVLISGSGAQNRDENLFGFKPFAILADALTQAGIAVLRYDDRGVGGSAEGTPDDTSETFAGDVQAAMAFLAERDDIDAAQIGLLGHSEGGIIAPLVAVETGDVAFLVLLAGPAITGRDLLIEQAAAVAAAGGADEAAVATTREQQQAALDAVLTGEGLDEIETMMVKEFRAVADQLPKEQQATLGDLDKWAEESVQAQLEMLQGAWMQFFLKHDPATTLVKVDAPVFALFGGKDAQVPPASNEAPMRAALEQAGHPNSIVTVFPDANHLFQAAQTGSPNEYATLAPEFAPGVVETIIEWVTAQVK